MNRKPERSKIVWTFQDNGEGHVNFYHVDRIRDADGNRLADVGEVKAGIRLEDFRSHEFDVTTADGKHVQITGAALDGVLDQIAAVMEAQAVEKERKQREHKEREAAAKAQHEAEQAALQAEIAAKQAALAAKAEADAAALAAEAEQIEQHSRGRAAREGGAT